MELPDLTAVPDVWAYRKLVCVFWARVRTMLNDETAKLLTAMRSKKERVTLRPSSTAVLLPMGSDGIFRRILPLTCGFEFGVKEDIAAPHQ